MMMIIRVTKILAIGNVTHLRQFARSRAACVAAASAAASAASCVI